MSLALALDRSVRTTSIDGHLHVAASHISKCAINPYKGSEIPEWERLGLDPNRIYQLFRDPDELARAAPTFNNLPVLSRHVPVSADAPQHELIMGSTGTDAMFADPYLDNSLVIWDAKAIAGIETGQQRELSSAYRYVADMTPGEHKGLRFDGIMRNIVGNHVALVEAGRAGSDVIVGDAKPEIVTMATKPLASRKAIMVRGALTAVARPLLAADAKVDFSGLLADVTLKNFRDKKAGILAALKPKLAKDAKLDTIKLALDEMDDDCDGAEDEDDLEDKGEEGAGEGASDEEGETDEEKAARMAARDKKAKDKKAKDAEPDMTKAMDAAIKAATTKVAADAKELREAERAVRPYVGEVAAMDSAEEVYRFALDSMGVKTDGVHASALPVILANLPKPSASKPRIAEDSAKARETANDMFPSLGRIGVG